jgi:hypothetical protein
MQRTSVAAYVKEFKDLALNIPDFSEAERLDRFKRGLKSNVRLHVALANPTTFEQAVTIAGQVDDILFGQRSSNPRPDNFRQRPNARAPENQATPMELGTMTQPKEREQFNNPTPERKYEIKNGLCFYCKEPGHMALHCPKKRPSGNYQNRR